MNKKFYYYYMNSGEGNSLGSKSYEPQVPMGGTTLRKGNEENNFFNIINKLLIDNTFVI